MLGHFVISISIWIFSIRSASGEDLVKIRLKFMAMEIFILFTQLLSVRQADDVVVHLPPSSKSSTSRSNTSITVPSYMVVALHGMGPNYPDLFQHEVETR